MSARKSGHERRPGQHYLAQLANAFQSGQLPELRAGTVNLAVVRHDSWCSQLAGSGPCDCSPEVEVRVLGTAGNDGKLG